MHFLTIVKILHLIGLVMGFGGAVLLDGTILTRGVIRPVSHYTIHQAHLLSRILTWGLALLWTTGIGLIWLNLLEKPEYLTNPKLWAKISIVVLLSLNGVLIHQKVLPVLKQKLGQRLFNKTSSKQIAGLTLLGSISFVSWTTPFVLGNASELNYITPLWVILSVYGAAVLTTWLGLFTVMGSIAAIQRAFGRIAAITMLKSDGWENDVSADTAAEQTKVARATRQPMTIQPSSIYGRA